jgi:hypothetical protein
VRQLRRQKHKAAAGVNTECDECEAGIYLYKAWAVEGKGERHSKGAGGGWRGNGQRVAGGEGWEYGGGSPPTSKFADGSLAGATGEVTMW